MLPSDHIPWDPRVGFPLARLMLSLLITLENVLGSRMKTITHTESFSSTISHGDFKRLPITFFKRGVITADFILMVAVAHF